MTMRQRRPPRPRHGHDHGDEGWAPADGWQRTFATTLTAAMTGAGFAAVLAAVSLISGLPITRQNGMIWGLCGFLAVTLAPAMGLPPELPGMPGGRSHGAAGLVGGHHRRHRRRHLPHRHAG